MYQQIFQRIKTIAVVGLSDKKERPSYKVALYLKSQGFRIIPVNPTISTWENQTAYPHIAAVPKDIKIDVVDIFRKSDEVMPIVIDTVKRGGIKTIWMQEGAVNKEASRYAKQHGLQVVENFCMMIAHKQLSNKTTP